MILNLTEEDKAKFTNFVDGIVEEKTNRKELQKFCDCLDDDALIEFFRRELHYNVETEYLSVKSFKNAEDLDFVVNKADEAIDLLMDRSECLYGFLVGDYVFKLTNKSDVEICVFEYIEKSVSYYRLFEINLDDPFTVKIADVLKEGFKMKYDEAISYTNENDIFNSK